MKRELFLQELSGLRSSMQAFPRGELNEVVERNVVDNLHSMYAQSLERYQVAVDSNSESFFDAQPAVKAYPMSERVHRGIEDLLERMELDFTQKMALDVQHGRDKEIEIGKIKIVFLDGVRRSLKKASLNG